MIKFPLVVFFCLTNLLTANIMGLETPKEVDSLQVEQTVTTQAVKPAKKNVVVPSNAKCPQWWQTAVDAGWAKKELPTLDMIMFRESRCLPKALNSQDPNTVDGIKGSLGLTQLNAFWVQSTTYYPEGYLQSLGVVGNIRDLYDPYLNLRSALEVWKYGEAKHGCGWKAWATPCN